MAPRPRFRLFYTRRPLIHHNASRRPFPVGRSGQIRRSFTTFQPRLLASTREPDTLANGGPRATIALDELLEAIRRKDLGAIGSSFVKWTNPLLNDSSPSFKIVAAELARLPAPVFTDILRSVDPERHPSHDVAHGLNISMGEVSRNNSRDLINEFGVRNYYNQLLGRLGTVMMLRLESERGLLPHDYHILMRVAGAAMDRRAAVLFYRNSQMDSAQTGGSNEGTWLEFLKVMHMVSPQNYQFDRSRVALMANDAPQLALGAARVRQLDNFRLSLSARRREPWNRRQDEPEEDVRRLLRRRTRYNSARSSLHRSHVFGYRTSEALICTHIVALARATSMKSIEAYIWKPFYNISILKDEEGKPLIEGGHDFDPQSPLKPTAALLDAIVEAYGTVAWTDLAYELVSFFSNRYSIAVPSRIWSNLLEWTYLSSSRPIASLREISPFLAKDAVKRQDVERLWDKLMEEPGFEPSIEDYFIYLKMLIIKQNIAAAVQALRTYIMPVYDKAVKDYDNALIDEILMSDVEPSPDAVRQRQRAEVWKDHLHYRISVLLKGIQKKISGAPRHRIGTKVTKLLPNLIEEFGDFFPDRIRYCTRQGIVQFKRTDATPRVTRHLEERTILPQTLGSTYASQSAEWPMIRQFNVQEWRPRPVARRRTTSSPPRNARWAETWWKQLERDLVL